METESRLVVVMGWGEEEMGSEIRGFLFGVTKIF